MDSPSYRPLLAHTPPAFQRSAFRWGVLVETAIRGFAVREQEAFWALVASRAAERHAERHPELWSAEALEIAQALGEAALERIGRADLEVAAATFAAVERELLDEEEDGND